MLKFFTNEIMWFLFCCCCCLVSLKGSSKQLRLLGKSQWPKVIRSHPNQVYPTLLEMVHQLQQSDVSETYSRFILNDTELQCIVNALHMNELCSESAFVSLICSPVQQSDPRYPANTIGYIVLYSKRFIILFTQITHEKQTKKYNIANLTV